MAQSLINPAVLDRLVEYADEFRRAQPFPHVVIDQFMRPEVAEAMLADFPTVADPSTLLSEFGTPNPKSAISDVRSLGSVFVDLDEYIQTDEFLHAIGAITGIPDLRYDPWYFGAGTHENFHGAGLDPHYDFNLHPKTRQHRRLNAIVYLNKDWDPAWKGDIVFHTNPWDLKGDRTRSVEPMFNRCVIFETTEESWHSVPPVALPEDKRHLSRKSFTIYLYTDERPTEQTAPDHGTVYVQSGLPDHIRAGRALTAQDMADIEANLQRRQDYLRAMYKREYQFSREIEALRAEISHHKLTAAKLKITGDRHVGQGGTSLFSRLRRERPLKDTVLFDRQWVKSRAPEAADLSLQQFLRDPSYHRIDPHPLFAAAAYLDRYPDVADGRVSPLQHYLEHGWLEGRDPHPLFVNDWYLEQNPDVLSSGTNPLEHYLQYGWKEGRRPTRLFDPEIYLERHHDVKTAGIEPFTHFVTQGLLAKSQKASEGTAA